MIKVHIMNGPEKDRVYDVKRNPFHIGRAPENDLQINDKSVSRVHLSITQKGNKYFVKDLESRNGTFIEGVRVASGMEYEVKEGMPIAVGKTFFSLGKAYPNDVLAALNSVDLFKELDDSNGSPPKDRPYTAKNNMELIYKVSNILMQSLTTKEVLERILHHVLELLRRIDRGVIILLNQESREIADVISVIKASDKLYKGEYSRTIVERVLREGKPMSMRDTLTESETNLSESIRLNKIRSVMCVPLISREQIMGVIYVDSLNKPHGFRKEDLDLLTALSSPAAVAIENSMLSSRENRPELS
jgi:pSer/pThr/pTyr-binding forkhead associated (FHA) protein